MPEMEIFNVKKAKIYELYDDEVREICTGEFSPSNEERNLLNVYPVQIADIIGFGGAFTDSAAYNYSLLSESERIAVLEALFGKSGLRYNLCRLCIGSSDFATEEYTYVDDGDTELKTFDISRDKRYVIPFVKDALKYTDGKITFFASPWAPPAFMKENGSRFKGGKLCDECYPIYAEYLVKFVEEYKKEGIEISALTLQNEPHACQTWESCEFEKEDEERLAYTLFSALKAHGLDVKILGWDHNKERLYERADHLFKTLGDAMWGAGFHWYSGSHFGAISALRAKYPQKMLIATEFCKTLTEGHDFVSGGYKNEILADISAGANGICEWNLILDENGGPYHNRCGGCNAPIIVDSKARTQEKTYLYHETYMFAHFIDTGAKSLHTSSFDDCIKLCAALNPSGTIVVNIMNDGNDIDALLSIDCEFMPISLKSNSLYTVVVENK